MQNILILYAEVMPYTVVTFESLIQNYPDVYLTVVHYGPEKKLSRYKVPENNRVHYHIESDLDSSDLLSLYQSLNPDLILCSGRMEKKYLKLLKVARRQNTVIVGNCDNHYNGGVRQRVAVLFSYFFYRQYFDYMLVPGEPQLEYCKKLGFKENQILFPQYCADVKLFERSYELRQKKEPTFSDLLYVGRLEKVKGIDGLVNEFINSFDQGHIQDKLIIVGDGSLVNELPLNHTAIEHHPFMSQEELLEFMASCKCFFLPSIREAWGVVIHEAAAAGMPIVTTTNCGAASQFVQDGQNGYLYDSQDLVELRKTIKKIASSSQKHLYQMGALSHELSLTIQPKMWADSLMKCINDSN